MLDSLIISSVKRTFSRSKFAQKFRDRYVVEGKVGKKGGKIVQCCVCKAHIPAYKSQIDHVEPIVPVMISGKIMSFIMLFERTFCKESNLQLLCPDCHAKKSKIEVDQRKKWRKKEKYLLIRHKRCVSMKILTITNLKEFPEDYEVLFVSDNIKNTQKELKNRIKVK